MKNKFIFLKNRFIKKFVKINEYSGKDGHM